MNNVKSLDDAVRFFTECGGTDYGYLNNHYDRFIKTKSFAFEGVEDSSPLRVLDIGSHWLHLAYFFVDEAGHSIHCGDAPNTMHRPEVIEAAKRMGVKLFEYKRLDLGDGIRSLPSDSFDLVLFSEIIEHLAFNPLVLWREVWRVMANNGRIIITTPNSIYIHSIVRSLAKILDSGCLGCSVDEILSIGTYGHHWKEYSPIELTEYFKSMDCGFQVTRLVVQSSDLAHNDIFVKDDPGIIKIGAGVYINVSEIENHLKSIGAYPSGNQIFCEVTVDKSEKRFVREPPWHVE